MGPLLDAHVDPEARRQRLLEADAHAEADDGGEGAVRNGRGDQDGDGGHDGRVFGGCGAGVGEGGGGGRRQSGGQGDVGEVDDGEGTEGEGVLGVLDGGYEICAEDVVLAFLSLFVEGCSSHGIGMKVVHRWLSKIWQRASSIVAIRSP